MPSFTDISPILLPEIPLRCLYVWSGYVEEDEWRIGDLLTHIATSFNKTLGEAYTDQGTGWAVTLCHSVIEIEFLFSTKQKTSTAMT